MRLSVSAALDSPPESSAALSQLYRIMNGLENALGGGEGCVGLYGSITPRNTELLFQSFSKLAGMSSESILMDVGSGLCRPLIHALATGRVAACRGVEIDRVKCQKAEAFIELTKKRMRAKGLEGLSCDFSVEVVNEPIEQIKSLDPVTHVYSFWEGVPAGARAGLGKLFRESRTTRAICVVQRAMRCEPTSFMAEEYGFGPLHLVDTRKVTMSGSGRSFTAYVFSKEALGVKRKERDADPIRASFRTRRSATGKQK